MKELLEKQLAQFKQVYNMGNKENRIEKIEVFSGVKASSYFVPDMFIGSDSSPEALKAHEDMRSKPAWFVEVFIDGLCVCRKKKMNANNENLQQYENELIEAILLETFFYGMNSAFQGSIEYNKRFDYLKP